MPLGTKVGFGPGRIVLHASQFPSQKGHIPTPEFSAHVYCGQTAGCIKMPLGMEIGFSPGDFVFDGDPAPPQKGTAPANFWPLSIVATVAHLGYC